MPESSSQEVGFAQQGSVDWVAFGSATPQFSIDVLARIQGAGVQPITYAAGLQLTTRFKLSELGFQRLNDTIKRLRVHSVASNLLYFGFGHRSFFRILTETQQGLKLIALCSCLAEAHSVTIAARILAALWKEYDFSEEYEPSHQQFEAIIKVCSGVFAASPFAEVQRRMMPADDTYPQCCDPADVAAALHGLFDITMKSKTRISVSGGSSCAFIAAVSHWLFNLDTYVENADGTVFFASSIGNRPSNPMSTEVYVKYNDVVTNPKLKVTEAAYVLGDIRDLIVLDQGRDLSMRSRVSWDVCLSQVFGKGFRDLMQHQETLGSFLGSIARVRLALAEGIHDGSHDNRRDFVDFAELSYGQGLITSFMQFFPELSTPKLRLPMSDAMTASCEHALDQVNADLETMQVACGCSTCCSPLDGLDPRKNFCLLAFAFTIANVVSIMSATEVESEMPLHPTRAGLLTVYQENCLFRLTRRSDKQVAGKRLYGHVVDMGSTLFGWHRPSSDWTLSLETVLTLFTGVVPDFKSTPYRIAMSFEGLCVFPGILLSLTSQAERLRRIFVIPGHLARLGTQTRSFARNYDVISDVSMEQPNMEQPNTLRALELIESPQAAAAAYDSTQVAPGEGLGASDSNVPRDWHLQLIEAQPGTKATHLSVTPEILESTRAGELALIFRVRDTEGQMLVSPGFLAARVLGNTGLVKCDSIHCPFDCSQATADFTVRQGWVIDAAASARMSQRRSRHVTCDWSTSGLTDLERLIAFASCQANGQYVILRRGECLACCIKVANRIERLLTDSDPDTSPHNLAMVYHIM